MRAAEITESSSISPSSPGKKTIWDNPECIWALFDDDLHNTLWSGGGVGGLTHLNPLLFCICRLQKACFQCRAHYQEETIKGKERAFKLGPFDCVTDCFQVRQLWEPQPEENCPSVQRSWEAGRLHGWHGAPEFQYYSRLVGFLWDLHWASRILLWLIAATLKAKSGQRRRGRRVSGLLNSYNYQHNVRDMPFIPSEDTSWA